jgi:hypothetical protein
MVAMLAMGVLVPAAHAQFYGETRRTAGLDADPLNRSPRLVGMGRLSLVLDDPHNRIDLWEFAGNPAGLLDADSVSAFELRPGTHSASAGTISSRTERPSSARTWRCATSGSGSRPGGGRPARRRLA